MRISNEESTLFIEKLKRKMKNKNTTKQYHRLAHMVRVVETVEREKIGPKAL